MYHPYMHADILGYGTRPSGFAALQRGLARLGYPGGAGLGYPMAAAGPTATMGPGQDAATAMMMQILAAQQQAAMAAVGQPGVPGADPGQQ